MSNRAEIAPGIVLNINATGFEKPNYGVSPRASPKGKWLAFSNVLFSIDGDPPGAPHHIITTGYVKDIEKYVIQTEASCRFLESSPEAGDPPLFLERERVHTADTASEAKQKTISELRYMLSFAGIYFESEEELYAQILF